MLLGKALFSIFCQKHNKANLAIPACALKKLKQHNWPGNIREMSHAIERAVLLTLDSEITTIINRDKYSNTK